MKDNIGITIRELLDSLVDVIAFGAECGSVATFSNWSCDGEKITVDVSIKAKQKKTFILRAEEATLQRQKS